MSLTYWGTSLARLSVVALVLLVSVYLILKYVLYYCFGIWVSSINVFSGKVRSIYIEKHLASIKVKSFGIRINLFNPRQKLFNVVVDGVKIELSDELGVAKQAKARSQLRNEKELLEEYLKPISIYPKSETVRFYLRHLSKWIPSVGVGITDINLSMKNIPLLLSISDIEFKNDYKIDKENEVMKFDSSLRIDGVYFAFQQEKAKVSSVIYINVIGDLDLQEGIISNLSSEFKFFSITITAFTILKCFHFIKRHMKSMAEQLQEKVKEERPALKRTHASLFAEDVCVLSLVVNLIRENSFRFDNITIDKIPLFSATEVSKICDDDFMSDNPEALVFLRAEFKSISANYAVLRENNAGFDINFQKGDHPFQLVLTLMQSLISIDLSHSPYSHREFKPIMCSELVNVPSVTISTVTNTLFQLIKRIQSGSKYADALWNFNCSVSNPIVDISTEQLGIFISRLISIRYQNTISRHQKAQRQTEEAFSKIEYMYYLSAIWPLINFKLLVERPTIILKTKLFDLETLSMAVIKVSLISIGVVTTKHVDFEGNLLYYLKGTCNIIDMVSLFIKKSTLVGDIHPESAFFEIAGDENVVKCSELSLKLDSKILPESKVACTVDYGSFSIDLSNLIVLNGLCDILTSIDDSIVYLTTEQVLAKRKCTEIKCQAKKRDFLKEVIFNDLPHWFDTIRIGGKHFKIVTGSRSVLIPAEIVSQFDIPNIIDNVDGVLRKISFFVLDWNIHIDNKNIRPLSDFSSSDDPITRDTNTAFESDTTSLEEDDFEEFWSISSTWKNAHSRVFTEDESEVGEINPYAMKLSNMMRIPNLEFVVRSVVDPATDLPILRIEGDCDEVSIHYSLINHFLIISSFHLLNNTLFKPVLEKFKVLTERRKVLKQPNASKVDPMVKVQNFLKMFHLRIQLHQFGVVAAFAQKFKLKFDGIRTVLLIEPGSSLVITNYLFRMMVESPTSPGFWARFITVNNSRIFIDINKVLRKGDRKIDEIGTLVDISNTGSRCSIPHQFVVHKMFDEISVAYKTVKQLHHSLKYNNADIVIYPHEMKTPRFPKIKIRSKRFIFKMDNDPFESELSMIFQLGLIEQRRRMEKYTEFKQKVSERLNVKHVDSRMEARNINTDGLLESSTAYRRHLSSFNKGQRNATDPGPFPFISQKLSKNDLINEEMHKVDELDRKIFLFRRHISRSWVELVRDYQQKMDDKIDENSKFLWNFLKASSYPVGFNHKVIGFPKTPPLMSLILEDLELSIKSPNFPLEKVSDFVHDVGKGVPLDTKYTILFPTNIDLKVKELRIHILDYPLPVVYIPEITPDQDQNLSALRISGTFVVGEVYSERPENIRKLYVPLVPLAKKAVNDKYFGLDVPKTIMSVKIFTTLQFDINSALPTRFTWGQSYQPAIQQIILNVDDFTKPQLDPSEKVGFWDKVRANFHARVQFKWAEKSELAITLKGGRSPYHLTGLSAGFLLIFKDNITLDINKDDNPKEFLAIKSDEVRWSIANHLALPLLLWYRESSRSLFIPDIEDYYLDSIASYYLDDQDEYNPLRVRKMSHHYQEKVAIRLCGDIVFKIGLGFERDENGEKTHNFMPHYDIHLSNPLFVKDKANYDAYRGFRSQYAHVSISLTSLDDVKAQSVGATKRKTPYNVLHLTPRAFTQFFAWWRLFSGNMELPIRRGVLFGPNRASKKFSEVLSTLQFQFLIAPLHISHIYREDSQVDNGEVKSECLGLKGKVDSFTVDLHERKEAVVNRYVELNKTKSFKKMKMYLGEVDMTNVDLRAVKAIFQGGDSRNDNFDDDMDWSEDGDNDDDDDDILEFGKHFKYRQKNVFKTYDNDPSWLDLDDYEEVGFSSIKHCGSFIKIMPLLFTPRFTYLRQLDHSMLSGVAPGDDELAHDCVLGANKFFETQKDLLQHRLKGLEEQLSSAKSKRVINNLNIGIANVKRLIELLHADNRDRDLVDEADEIGFNNKFVIHNVQVKWNKEVRDIMYRYSHFLTFRSAVQNYLRYQSFAVVERIVEDQRLQTIKTEYLEEHHTRRDEFTYDDITCSERLDNFDEDLRRVLNSSFRSSDDYLVKLISPQIQLCTEDVKSDSCILVTSPEIELKIVSVKQAATLDENGNEILIDSGSESLEKRYGSLFRDANIFVVYKKEVIPNVMSTYLEDCYGSTSNWPPWIGVELCYDGEVLSDKMILQKTSLVFRYDRSDESIANSNLNDRKRVIVDIPQVTTSCDSDQYYAFYDMVLNLMMYKEPSDKIFHEKLTSLMLTTDFADLFAVKDRIRNLQISHTVLTKILERLTYKRAISSDDDRDLMKRVISTKLEIISELFLLMRLVSKGKNLKSINKDEELEWTIRADEIKVHMLDSNRKPFVDLIVKEGVFRRIEESSNSNTNIVQINELDAYNLEKGAVFPEMITTYHHVLDEDEPHGNGHISSEDADKAIVLEWAMDQAVGGIKVVRSVIVNLLPMRISMEQETGEKLFNYLFPPTEHSTHTNVLTLNNEVKTSMDRDDEILLYEMKKLKRKSLLRPRRFPSITKTIRGDSNSSNSSDSLSLQSVDSSKGRAFSRLKVSTSNGTTNGSINSSNSSLPSLSPKKPDPKYVSQMITRASTFMSIVALTINSFVLNISFRGEGKYRLVNVSDLTLKMPKLQFHNKIWTIEELMNHLKKLIIKLVLNHSGIILANKITPHRKRKSKIVSVHDDGSSDN